MKNLLLLEDDASLGATLKERLEREGHRVVWSESLAEAEKTIRGSFREILGSEVSVDFQRVLEIPRTAGGKYMTALSELAD